MNERPNNAMQLTKLRAAPVLQAEVPPCAPAGQTGGGTASQLIASVDGPSSIAREHTSANRQCQPRASANARCSVGFPTAQPPKPAAHAKEQQLPGHTLVKDPS
jgi:hypothetical protein